MHPDMLLLVERLVVAMEAVSQDVKNMSSYVYDLSCSVSYLVNEKRDKECISVAAIDECVSPAFVACAARQAAPVEKEYAGQYELVNERSSSYTGDPHHVVTSFSAGIKLEEHSEDEVNDESCDMYVDSRNTDRFIEGIKMEEQSEDDVNDASVVMYGDSRNIDRGDALHTTSIAEQQVRPHQFEIPTDPSVVHGRVDSEERPHKCSMCEKSFRSGCDLRRHTRVHSGERPYKCNVCGKAFSENATLRTHMRSHTGEKPYKCTLCGKAFGYRSGFSQHMHTHSAEHSFQ